MPENRIVFLIPENDFGLKKFLINRKYLHFEGSETDVRQRYIFAAEKFRAEQIIRLTGDNPFVDIAHLELLCETLGESGADIISFSNLPIGMGGELFTVGALCNEPLGGLQERHREHVSLHLKEDPSRFKFVKAKPNLSEEEVRLCHKIRLTIDEEKDFEVAETVYNELINDNYYFGAKEVAWLYKRNPGLFQRNQSVEQVHFSIQVTNDKPGSKIRIIYAPPGHFGSGHYERSKILFAKLSALGHDVSLSPDLHENENCDLTIFDYRDLQVPEKMRSQKLLLIDNFGPDRNLYSTFDVLPHPKLDFQESLKNILFPSLISYYKEYPSESKNIVTYAGGRDKKESFALDEFLYGIFGSKYNYIRVGGDANSAFPVEVIFRLSRKEFLGYLGNCAFFCTYFGQSLMEAAYLQKKTLIYSISDYHTELGKFFSENSGLAFIGSIHQGLDKISANSIEMPDVILENSGFHNLIGKIQEILNS